MGVGGFPVCEGLRERVQVKAGVRRTWRGVACNTQGAASDFPPKGRISTLDILPCSRLPSLDDTTGSFGDCAGVVTRHRSRSSATGE
jgi:hypothetical protein